MSCDVSTVVSSFVEKVVSRYADRVDRENLAPPEFFREAAEQGVFGLPIPREYGGWGLPFPDFMDALRLIARESPSIAHIVFVHSMSAYFVEKFGSEELRKEILPGAARGERILALAFTEPGAGSDLASIETRAERRGDAYVLEGEKLFTTNALYADTFIVLARTGPPEARHKALTLFAVDKSEGLEVGEPLDILGFRGTGLARVFFRGVEVPVSRVLGRENEGFKPAVVGLGVGRLPFASIALGIAEGALWEAAKWALERRSFGRPIFENQAVSFPLAEVAAEVEAVKALIRRAAELHDKGENILLLTSMAKLLAARLAVKATRVAVQVMGGRGLLSASKVSRLYRDAKAAEIAEGTNEVQLMIIARDLAKRVSSQG